MAAPYDVKLHPDDARRFAEHGGTLLLMGVPEGTSFGIDQQMFVVGPRFKGLKMLPPGPRFVYYSAANKQGGAGPITGFFVIVKEGQVVVREWDAREERLAQLDDEDQVERLVAGVKSFQFDSSLGAYDLHRFAAWQTLSGYITQEVVHAHEPIGGDICVIFEASVDEKRPKTGAEKRLQEQIHRGRERKRSGADYQCKAKGTEKERPRDDVSKGVIIVDHGEDREATAKLMVDGSKTNSAQKEGAMSKADQIAVMFQQKEAREGSQASVGAGNRNGSNGEESHPMEVDSEEQNCLGTSGQERLQRRDFAGLRDSQSTLESAPASNVASTSEAAAQEVGKGDVGRQNRESTSGRATGRKSGLCFYTKLPRLVKQPGMSPRELTALNLDKSALLETVLSKEYEGREELLLGEMQFAFIAFVMGQSLESFQQWKAMLHLLLGCVEAPLRTRTRLFAQVMSVLYWQLRHGLVSSSDRTSGDALLDETWFQRDNFLQHLLNTFFSVLREAQPIDGELKRQADLAQSLLERSLGWSFPEAEGAFLGDEDDEYAPTIVC